MALDPAGAGRRAERAAPADCRCSSNAQHGGGGARATGGENRRGGTRSSGRSEGDAGGHVPSKRRPTAQRIGCVLHVAVAVTAAVTAAVI
eukprot:gene18105-biopygen2387